MKIDERAEGLVCSVQWRCMGQRCRDAGMQMQGVSMTTERGIMETLGIHAREARDTVRCEESVEGGGGI